MICTSYNYLLRIICTGWTGNFERELLAYALGCLDDMQMGDFAEEEMAAFWQEEYGMKPPEDQATLYDRQFIENTGYDILADYLAETYQEVDDWHQNTFYNVRGIDKTTSEIFIQLVKPLPDHVLLSFVNRTNLFFERRIYEYLTPKESLVKIVLEDAQGHAVTIFDKTRMKSQAITIDGPAGAGKTTMAKALANVFPNFKYVDTGAFYRSAAYAVKDHLTPDHLPEKLPLEQMDIKAVLMDGRQTMLLHNQPLADDDLRTEQISQLASALSARPEIRNLVNQAIRDYAGTANVIMEGRDTGTAILPDAQVKFYLNAPVETRARRRWIDLTGGTHDNTSYREVLEDVKKRDDRDMNREHDPLRQATDAIYLDNQDLDIDQCRQLMEYIIQTHLLTITSKDLYPDQN